VTHIHWVFFDGQGILDIEDGPEISLLSILESSKAEPEAIRLNL